VAGKTKKYATFKIPFWSIKASVKPLSQLLALVSAQIYRLRHDDSQKRCESALNPLTCF
jgi:hypothetical protein